MHSVLERRPSRKFISLGEVTPCASEWWCKTKIKKGQRSRSLVTKCKDRFSCISHQKWIDLRQTKTEMIKGTLQTHIVECISPAEMPRFVTFVWSYPWGPHVVTATWPCTGGMTLWCGWPQSYQRGLVMRKLERYVKPFWHNTGASRTDWQSREHASCAQHRAVIKWYVTSHVKAVGYIRSNTDR